MTVGVMCSCLLSFPIFFRYHLPVFESILSFFKSRSRLFYIPGRRDRSGDDNNVPCIRSSPSKPPAARNIRATFSSPTGGRGRFIIPASVPATDPEWLPPSNSVRSFYPQNNNLPEPTHRENYERMAEEQQSRIHTPPASHNQHSRQSPIQSNSPVAPDFRLPNSEREPRTKPSRHGGNAWWKIRQQSNTTRTGYWDVLSFFHTNNTISPDQSEARSESGLNAV